MTPTQEKQVSHRNCQCRGPGDKLSLQNSVDFSGVISIARELKETMFKK